MRNSGDDLRNTLNRPHAAPGGPRRSSGYARHGSLLDRCLGRPLARRKRGPEPRGEGFFCVLPLVALLLGGCISTNTPGDLTMLSVQSVDWRDQDELPGPGVSPALGMVRDRDLALMGQSITGGEKPHRPLLKIEFTSTTNLSKFVIVNSYNLGNTAFLCDRRKDSAGLSFPDIYWHGIRLGEHEFDPIERHSDAAGAPITYYIFIDVAREKVVPSKPPREGFDLRQNPENVCFYLAGGNESGRGYRSNMVTIPKDVIAAALAK